MSSNIDYVNNKAKSWLISQKSEQAYKEKQYEEFIRWTEEQTVTNTSRL